jgi:pimeloyl-ACP methyl ester carboxylesterase
MADCFVKLWHGGEAAVIRLHHGRYLASVIPGATLRICPGEGHMLMWNHLPEILMAAAGMPSQPESLRRLPALHS